MSIWRGRLILNSAIKEKTTIYYSLVFKRKLELLGLEMYIRMMNKTCYIFQKQYFESCLRYVLPAKVVTFTHDICMNDGCRESSAVRDDQRSKDRGESSSSMQNRVICRSKCKAFRKGY